LGYTDGDNKFTYAEPSADNAHTLLTLAVQSADTVIVDCAGSLNWELNKAAMASAGAVFRLYSPTLKSVSFFSSQLPLYQHIHKGKANVAGLVETEPGAPLDQARHYFRDTDRRLGKEELENLTNLLYREMAEYSIVWNDVALTYTDGRIVKLPEHFHSPEHSVDIIKRLLHNSGMIIDNSTPISQGHLPDNTRITAVKSPVADEGRGAAVSIRLLHPQKVTRPMLLDSGTATGEMLDFLCMCVRYGVSVVVAGATSSGKTTLLNCLLGTVPDDKRLFTIESGCREFSLVRERDGRVVNNVVHTLSRPSDNPAFDISQDRLVVCSLRFNPDIVVCVVSLALFVAGGVLAVSLGNPFLAPVSAAALAMLPFGCAKSTLSYYDKHVREEMETALSIITTS